jgi:hypothetical protein
MIYEFYSSRISHVYGRQRTAITPTPGDIEVVHYIYKHPRRYRVDFQHEKQLPQLILDGQRAIFDWMMEHKRPLSELNTFRESCVQYGQKDAEGIPLWLLNVTRRRAPSALADRESIGANTSML